MFSKSVIAKRSQRPCARKGLRRAARAFTLVEVMVACAVLAILLGLLSSSTSSFTRIALLSNKRLEAAKVARTAFDRLNFDFNSSIHHGGVSVRFLKKQTLAGAASDNDAVVLLADARTTQAGARLAKVGYEVGPITSASREYTHGTLLRHVEPFLWDDNAGNIAISPAAALQPLAPGIFRFEIAFLQVDGTIVAVPPAPEKIQAVICALGILDEESLALLSDAERALLVTKLPEAVDGSTPISRWNVASLGDLPKPARENIRFYQRYFYLK